MSKDIPVHPTAGSHLPLVSEAGRFRRALGSLSLFSLPVMYLGIILAVSIHEAIGHGLAAAFLGGKFNGFGVLLDGMGWADIEIGGLSTLSQALVYAAGGFSTTIFSALCFGLSKLFSRNPFLALTFLVWGAASLTDGLPYFFWDAIRPGGIGDFSIIWLLYHSQVLRVAILVLCGAGMAAGIVFFNIRYYKLVYAWLGAGKPLDLKRRILCASVIFLLEVLAWFSFDWEQLVPGIGLLPSIAGAALALVTLIPLIASYEIERSGEPAQEIAGAKVPICIAWAACLAVVFVILQWLQNGIAFS